MKARVALRPRRRGPSAYGQRRGPTFRRPTARRPVFLPGSRLPRRSPAGRRHAPAGRSLALLSTTTPYLAVLPAWGQSAGPPRAGGQTKFASDPIILLKGARDSAIDTHSNSGRVADHWIHTGRE